MLLTIFLTVLNAYTALYKLSAYNFVIYLSYTILSAALLSFNIFDMLFYSKFMLHDSDAILYYDNAIGFLNNNHFTTDFISIKYYGFIFYDAISMFPFHNFEFSIIFVYINNLLIFSLTFSFILLYFQKHDASSNPKVLFILYPFIFMVYNYLITFNLRDLIILSILISALLVYKMQKKNNTIHSLLILSTLIFFRFELLIVILLSIVLVVVIDKYSTKYKFQLVIITSILVFTIPLLFNIPTKDFLGGKILEILYLPNSEFYNYQEKISFISMADNNEIGHMLTVTYFKQLPAMFFSFNPYRYLEQWLYANDIKLLISQHLFRVTIGFFLILIIYPYFFSLIFRFKNIDYPFSFKVISSSFMLNAGLYILKFNIPDFRIMVIILPLILIELTELKDKIRYFAVFLFSFFFFFFSLFFDLFKEIYLNAVQI